MISRSIKTPIDVHILIFRSCQFVIIAHKSVQTRSKRAKLIIQTYLWKRKNQKSEIYSLHDGATSHGQFLPGLRTKEFTRLDLKSRRMNDFFFLSIFFLKK